MISIHYQSKFRKLRVLTARLKGTRWERVVHPDILSKTVEISTYGCTYQELRVLAEGLGTDDLELTAVSEPYEGGPEIEIRVKNIPDFIFEMDPPLETK